MSAKALMVQGTCSNAGKSLLVTALCRIYADLGYKVAPFKSQNMALNSFPTLDGHEIGRAQALQAVAARIEPHIDMNPILLKPNEHNRSQVIVRGKVYKNMSAREYYAAKEELFEIVKKTYAELSSRYNLIIIEGAGSPAEINLKDNDIANMKVAHLAQAPVILVGDIDKGGVFASLIGTLALLDDSEKAMVKGLVINKFRGDETLLDSGIEFLEKTTKKHVLGVLPYLTDLRLDGEDSLTIESSMPKRVSRADVDIAVIRLPHISNFTDIDAFAYESGVNLRYIKPGAPIGETDLLIIPGTKNTIGDLNLLHTRGTSTEIRDLSAKGIPVIGICGGYQMLGRYIEDPLHIESDNGKTEGLALLECDTQITDEKTTVQVQCELIGTIGMFNQTQATKLRGYEIHMGKTVTDDNAASALRITKRGNEVCDILDGCVSDNGLVFGTYIHGLFDNGKARKAVIDFLRRRKGLDATGHSMDYEALRESQIDILAQVVTEKLDMAFLHKAIGLKGK